VLFLEQKEKINDGRPYEDMTEFWAAFAGVSTAVPGQMTVSVFWNEYSIHMTI